MCKICSGDDVSNLIFLDCSGCETVESLPESLPKLRILLLNNTTQVKTIPSYESLADLYCSNSAVEALPSLPVLKKLIADGSKLTKIPAELYCVETINVNETAIAEIPRSLISLAYLSAKRTFVSTISGDLISLIWLNVKGSNLSLMPSSMPSLQYLNCSDTNVADVNLVGYKMLQTVYCRGCGIDPFSIENPTGVSIFTC